MIGFIKEYKFIISLLILIGIMAIIAHWDETKTQQEEAHESVKDKIFSFKFQDVVSINYYNDGDSIKEFSLNLEEGENAHWILSGGDIKEIPDQSFVSTFVETLVSLTHKRTFGVVEDPTKLKAYGITDSKMRFKIGLKDSKDITIIIGGSPSVGNGVYLSIDGVIYICEEFVKHGLSVNFTSFRDKKVIKLDPSRINGLSFLYPNSSLQIEKKDGSYKIKNEDKLLDKNLVENFIAILNSTLVSSFIDHPDGKINRSMKTSKFLDLFIIDDKDREIKLEFSFFDGNVYFKFRGRDIVYVAGADLKNTLTKQEKDFIPSKSSKETSSGEESKVEHEDGHDHSHHDHGHTH